ncbi:MULTISPECIES: hypothetical protein [Methanobrevibacter]|uniref:hypothetical protein n=1 Tax=Methanobrevibacter TaxID=2172 RepID=UPI00084C8463|nr:MULTISPECIES: hypothetical protein [Methanobrevibacter]OED01007.1 hypothetical protein A9505_02655 [Methanobrevibacter sp. A27]
MTKWDAKIGDYYFSVIDVVDALEISKIHHNIGGHLKVVLMIKNGQSVTISNRLKMPAKDGKLCETDVANTKQLFVSYNLFLLKKQNHLNNG